MKGEGLDAEYIPEFVLPALASEWFEALRTLVSWEQHEVVVYGKNHLTPRLSCWMGEPWMTYSYSQNKMQPVPWLPLIEEIKHYVERCVVESFNSVLLNYYRDGQDSNGWHADDEPELGDSPIIASVSLGASRDFLMRRKEDYSDKRRIALEHGSLLIMRGDTQNTWQHQVPKRASAGPRINLTFRTIIQ